MKTLPEFCLACHVEAKDIMGLLDCFGRRSIQKQPKGITQTQEEIDRYFSTPAGIILTQAYMASCMTEEVLIKRLPWILEYPRGKEFCNVLQVATILATLLHIERLNGRQDYFSFHAKLVDAIAPEVRHIYMPLLFELSSYLLKRPVDTKHLPAYDEIQDWNKGDVEEFIGFWCIRYLKMSVLSTRLESELSEAIRSILYEQHVPFIVGKLSTYNMLTQIV